MNKRNVIISACLMGTNCRYDGKGAQIEELEELMEGYSLIPVCPEIFGGLPIPRDPGERIGDKVITINGEDVTEFYVKGSEEVVKLARLYGCDLAILKERSPSCGYGTIYDGSFTNKRIKGNGILADALLAEGVRILGESNLAML